MESTMAQSLPAPRSLLVSHFASFLVIGRDIASLIAPLSLMAVNSPPLIAAFNPKPDNTAQPTLITCGPVAVSDPDAESGDTVPANLFTYTWFVDGVQDAANGNT